MEISSYQI